MGPESLNLPQEHAPGFRPDGPEVLSPGSRTHWWFPPRIQRPAMTPKRCLSMVRPQKILLQGNDNPPYLRKHLPSSWWRSLSPLAGSAFVWIRNGHAICVAWPQPGVARLGRVWAPPDRLCSDVLHTHTWQPWGEHREKCAVGLLVDSLLCYLLTVRSRESCSPLRCLSPQT